MNTIVRRTPEEVKRLWIDALRSDKYEQISGRLIDEHGFCVLGVLYELAVIDGGHPWDWISFSATRLPNHFKRYLHGIVPSFDVLATMNDDYRHTFRQLADYIEHYRSRK